MMQQALQDQPTVEKFAALTEQHLRSSLGQAAVAEQILMPGLVDGIVRLVRAAHVKAAQDLYR